jgi:hypothetical protein
MARQLLLMQFVICALIFAGCGGTNAISPSSTQPQPTVLNFSQTVSGSGYWLQDVTVYSRPVQVDVRLNWTDPRKDLDLYWTNASCSFGTESFVGTGCQILFTSVSSQGTTEGVLGTAAAGATVRLFIFNFAASPEAATVKVTMIPQ